MTPGRPTGLNPDFSYSVGIANRVFGWARIPPTLSACPENVRGCLVPRLGRRPQPSPTVDRANEPESQKQAEDVRIARSVWSAPAERSGDGAFERSSAGEGGNELPLSKRYREIRPQEAASPCRIGG